MRPKPFQERMKQMKKREFIPDYRNVEMAARNQEAARPPLYEHNVSVKVMEQITGKQFGDLIQGSYKDKVEFFKQYSEFFKSNGYDVVTFECCIGSAMPGSGALGGHKKGVIQTREDFEKYPWEEIEDRYFTMFTENFSALQEAMPAGMKAIGGVGNGIFECVQDVVGYMDLCYMQEDDPELYRDMFRKVGETNLKIWKRFLDQYADLYCVLRFGDDLGFKSTTLLSDEDIRNLIVPEYRRIISLVHSYQKPFLLHSCGCIFNVMEDIIGAGIDAKHSNEDQIAPFTQWVEQYGDRIGNFGGFDVDEVCRADKKELKEYVSGIMAACRGKGGVAFGTGNSIPDYMPPEAYANLIESIREARGEE